MQNMKNIISFIEKVEKCKEKIKKHEEKLKEYKIELESLIEIPKYINDVIKLFKDIFGNDKIMLEFIKKILVDNLKTVPKFDSDVEWVKKFYYNKTSNITYEWNNELIKYERINEYDRAADCELNNYTKCEIIRIDTNESAYDIDNKLDKPYIIHYKCEKLYEKPSWDLLKDFDIRFLPILVEYFNENFH